MPAAESNIFGRLVTRRDVELAVVAFLQEWTPAYVAEIERQSGLEPATIPMPPDPRLSYRGGLDFETWEPAWSPTYVVVAQPFGAPIRVGGEGSYIQQFDLQIACNFQLGGQDESLGAIEEDSARGYADMLGMAACAAMVQHGGLGQWPDGSPVSFRTWMTQYPRTEFPNPGERRVCRSYFTVAAMIADVVTEADGPRTASPGNPYADPGNVPEIGSVGIEVDAVSDDEKVP